MKKYWKILWNVIKQSDILLEVVDARMPLDTRIEKLEKKIDQMGKDLIIVLNKSDLVPEEILEEMKKRLEFEFPVAFVSTKTRKGSRTLRKLIKLYAPNKEKVIIGVFGLPNTGKSSIINMLIGRHRARTSPIPGFTKGMQLLKLSRRFYLIDTPGVYIPKGDKYYLAVLGCFDPAQLDYPEKAVDILIQRLGKKFLREHYEIDFEDTNDLLRKIKEKYKLLNEREAARKILLDWVKGKIRGYFSQ